MRRWVVGVLLGVLSLVVLAGAALVCLDQWGRHHPQDLRALPTRTLMLHGQTLTVRVADTPSTAGPGLSGQESLPAGQGLLLVSPNGDTTVTMLGMRFPLDVVWLDADHRVVAIRADVPARPVPLAYTSPVPAVAVLELASGEAGRLDLQVGDVVEWS